MKPLDVSADEMQAFRRFLSLLPHGGHRDLVLLKAHLLIEEQIRRIIDINLPNPKAIVDTRIDCHQAICLAQAFFSANSQPWLWASVKKLNSIRNDVAHKLEPKGLNDKIEEFCDSFPSGFSALPSDQSRFELTLWSVFVAVSQLADTSTSSISEGRSS
jgi:hypothetical protein